MKNVYFYPGPKKSIWYLTGENPAEESAVVHVLNDNPLTWKDFDTSFLTRLMDAAEVRKLYALVPKPAKKIKRIARLLGFRHEGALREAVKFDGRRVSLEVFGLLRQEVERNGKAKTTKSGIKGREVSRDEANDGRAIAGARRKARKTS